MSFPTWVGPTCSKTPQVIGTGREAGEQPRGKPWTHVSVFLSALTGSPNEIPRAAQTSTTHWLLSTTSGSAELCLAPCPSHSPPVPPVGDGPSPRPSCPAASSPCPLLPPIPTPQVEHCLCHLHLGDRAVPLWRSSSPHQVKADGQKGPETLGELLSLFIDAPITESHAGLHSKTSRKGVVFSPDSHCPWGVKLG